MATKERLMAMAAFSIATYERLAQQLCDRAKQTRDPIEAADYLQRAAVWLKLAEPESQTALPSINFRAGQLADHERQLYPTARRVRCRARAERIRRVSNGLDRIGLWR